MIIKDSLEHTKVYVSFGKLSDFDKGRSLSLAATSFVHTSQNYFPLPSRNVSNAFNI